MLNPRVNFSIPALILTLLILSPIPANAQDLDFNQKKADKRFALAEQTEAAGDYEPAAEQFLQAVNTEKSSATPRADLVIRGTLRAGDCRLRLNDPATALRSYAAALSECKTAGSGDLTAETRSCIAAAYHRQGELEKAIKQYRAAASHYLKAKKETRATELVYRLGWAYFDAGTYDEAIKYLKNSLSRLNKASAQAVGAERRVFERLLSDNYRMLAMAYLRTNAPENAFTVLKLQQANLISEDLIPDDKKPSRVKIDDAQAALGAD